jgi:hypothetical protein
MTTPDPTSPHDAVFKAIFSQPENAVLLLREGLPPELFQRLEPASLGVVASGFVDDELRSSHSDLLLKASLVDGPDVLVYVLIEHQRTTDPLMPYRLLRYIVRAWEAWLRENDGAKRLPAVIPLVVHQGAQAWSGPTRVRETIDLPANLLAGLERHLPSLELQLIDLGDRSEAAIAALEGSAAARFALLLMFAAARAIDFLGVVERHADMLRALYAESHGRENLGILVSYTLLVGRVDVGELGASMRKAVGPEASEVVMTTGQQLIERGREQGLEQGRKQLRDVLARLLRARFGTLDDVVLARLDNASAQDLARWADRELAATRLEDVFTG